MMRGKTWSVKALHMAAENTSGEAYLDLVITFSVIFSLIFCFLSVTPVFVKKQNLDYMAGELARTIEITGSRGDEFVNDLNRMKNQTGLDPTVSMSGDFTGDKIQFRKKFTLTLKDFVVIRLADPSFAPPLELKIPIIRSVTGVSEYYWKPGEV